MHIGIKAGGCCKWKECKNCAISQSIFTPLVAEAQEQPVHETTTPTRLQVHPHLRGTKQYLCMESTRNFPCYAGVGRENVNFNMRPDTFLGFLKSHASSVAHTPHHPNSIQATRKLLQSDKFLAFLSSEVKIFRRHCRGDESDFYWYVKKM